MNKFAFLKIKYLPIWGGGGFGTKNFQTLKDMSYKQNSK